MPTIQDRHEISPASSEPEADALLRQVHLLPEAEALQLYARLSPRLQWLARQRTSGPRRSALIVHHALTHANAR
jgi:hypothetical protein